MENNVINAAALTIEQYNASEKKNALQAAKNAVLSHFDERRLDFLASMLFDERERAYISRVEYTAKKKTENGIETYTANAALRVSIFDFVTDKEEKKTLRERVEKLAELASVCSKENVNAAVPYIKNVCTLCGLHSLSEKVNERDAKRILRAAYTVTDRNDDTAKEREIKRAIAAMLCSMASGHESTNVYRAEKAAKAAAAAAKAAEKAAEKAAKAKAAFERENELASRAEIDAKAAAAAAEKAAKAN